MEAAQVTLMPSSKKPPSFETGTPLLLWRMHCVVNYEKPFVTIKTSHMLAYGDFLLLLLLLRHINYYIRYNCAAE